MPPAESGVPRTVRCGAYTRKSTEEGLSQFNSLDAQRNARKPTSSATPRGRYGASMNYDPNIKGLVLLVDSLLQRQPDGHRND